MGSDDRRVVVTVSTENDWRESFASNEELPLQQWVHVAVRCDGRQKSVSIHINGLADAEHRLSSPTKPNPHPFYIGQPPEGVSKVHLTDTVGLDATANAQHPPPPPQEGSSLLEGCPAFIRDMRFFTRLVSLEEIESQQSLAHTSADLRAQHNMPFV